MPSLLASLTSKLEMNWQSSTIQHLINSNDCLEKTVAQQLPPLIQPKLIGLNGSNGSVPVSFSFTWTRYQPTIEVLTDKNDASKSIDNESLNIKLNPFIEPEVVILLTTDQIKNLLNKSSKQELHENPNLIAFGTTLMNLQRPITCIFLTGPTFKSNTRVTSNLNDIAMILNAITRSLAERPFK
ncbi:unnamed protein product [Schistosoma turkestanicum]|nr:unnamed protein product [Schistosoma turkestanicum]